MVSVGGGQGLARNLSPCLSTLSFSLAHPPPLGVTATIHTCPPPSCTLFGSSEKTKEKNRVADKKKQHCTLPPNVPSSPSPVTRNANANAPHPTRHRRRHHPSSTIYIFPEIRGSRSRSTGSVRAGDEGCTSSPRMTSAATRAASWGLFVTRSTKVPEVSCVSAWTPSWQGPHTRVSSTSSAHKRFRFHSSSTKTMKMAPPTRIICLKAPHPTPAGGVTA